MTRVERNKKVALVLVILGLVLIIAGFIAGWVEDYKCNTTKDIEWFNRHNCIKYWED